MLKNYKFLFSLVLLLACLLSSNSLLAQQSAQINYQGVARKADGSAVMGQSIKLRLTIHDGSATGTSVYSETRQLTTNKFGLFTTVIGSSGALSQSGTLAAVNWSTGNKFLQVELDPQGGNSFVNMGTSQLQSVPYAIYAGSATPGGAAAGDLSGTYPNPTVSKLQGKDINSATPNTGQVLKWNGTEWIPSDEEGAVGTLTANLPITATTVGRNSAISINKADASTDGFLSKNDWLIFNGKASITYVDEVLGLQSDALATEKARALAAEAKKEDADNKSTDMVTDAASDIKYPTVKSVKTYMDANASTGSEALATEIERAKAAENTITTSLAGEVTRATTAEATLTTAAESNATAITTETIRAKAAETTLSTATETNATAITSLSTVTQTALDAKVNIADTTTMLSPYAKQIAIQTALASKLNIADTTAMLLPYAKNAATLSAINTKLNIADTTAMLSPYAKSAATLSAISTKLNIADTTAMLLPYAKNAKTLTAISTKLNIADTTAMLLPYAKSAATLSAINTKLNIADTTAMLLPYAKSAATLFAISTKLNTADTTAMLLPYAKNGATLSAINTKLNIADTTTMLLPYAKSAATLTAISTKLNISDTTAMLSPYAKQEVLENLVDLTTAQSISGAKVFSEDITVSGVKIGTGAGDGEESTAVGRSALGTGTGKRNSAFGNSALSNYAGTGFDNNTAIGYANSRSITTGQQNTSVGAEALISASNASHNTSIGAHSMLQTTGASNTALGYRAGAEITSGGGNTMLGTNANVLLGVLSNATAIGNGAQVAASNTMQLGNTAVTAVKTSGTITAGQVTYPNTKGTVGQVLTTDADGVASWTTGAAIREIADEFTATASQESFTLSQAPSANSKVKMYINGIRISNTAYSITSSALTYTAANNGSYALSAGDRIQFDYYY